MEDNNSIFLLNKINYILNSIKYNDIRAMDNYIIKILLDSKIMNKYTISNISINDFPKPSIITLKYDFCIFSDYKIDCLNDKEYYFFFLLSYLVLYKYNNEILNFSNILNNNDFVFDNIIFKLNTYLLDNEYYNFTKRVNSLFNMSFSINNKLIGTDFYNIEGKYKNIFLEVIKIYNYDTLNIFIEILELEKGKLIRMGNSFVKYPNTFLLKFINTISINIKEYIMTNKLKKD